MDQTIVPKILDIRQNKTKKVYPERCETKEVRPVTVPAAAHGECPGRGKKGTRGMPRPFTVEELELKVQGGQGSWSLQGTELQRTLDISRGTHEFSANQCKQVRKIPETGGESTQRDCGEQPRNSCRTRKNVFTTRV